MSNTKPTILFIVEGVSDKTALKKIFQKIYWNKGINFEVTGGDITSDENTTVLNVEEKLYKIVNSFIDDKKLSKRNIQQIVQIFDTDGAYISDDHVELGESSTFLYTPTSIKCKYPENVINRNEQKRQVMNYLLSLSEIRGIPYEKYFMSCNLDHALYGEQNLELDLKQDYADAFYETFKDAPRTFIEFLNEDVANGVPDSYPGSWRFIQKELHSLERHTNLHIYFSRNPISPLY